MTKQMSFDDYLAPEKDFTSFIDGLCEPVNPGGVATYGFVVYDRNMVKIHQEAKFVGKGDGMSNNVAEYSGLVALLEYLIQKGIQGNISVKLDSKLVVEQMTGKWKVKNGLYVAKFKEAKRLMFKVNASLRFIWVNRENNAEADQLSRQAYEEYCRDNGHEVNYHSDTLSSQ